MKHKASKCAQKTSSSRGINAKLGTSTRAEGFELKAFACLVTAHLSGGPRKAVGMARFAGMNVSELYLTHSQMLGKFEYTLPAKF